MTTPFGELTGQDIFMTAFFLIVGILFARHMARSTRNAVGWGKPKKKNNGKNQS
jgi:hypothetical protein